MIWWGGSRRASIAAVLAVVGLLLGLGWILASGCKTGQGPTELPGSNGPPFTFLPPGGVALGTGHKLGVIYRFGDAYQLFQPLQGTDPRYIRRDSVLAPAGATIAIRRKPDSLDVTLRQVYANPDLFGFEHEANPDSIGFKKGRVVERASEFFPLPTTGPTWWKYNHNQLEWTRTDTIIGPATARTALPGQQVVRVRSICEARVDRRPIFKPAVFPADVLASSDPSQGVWFHAWTLVAERVVNPADCGSRNCVPPVQRNPRFLWLSIGTLGFRDPSVPIPTTPDQCLDGVEAYLQYYPVKLCGPSIRIGDIYSTWTYLSVDSAEVGRRTRSQDELERLRCRGLGTLPQFPTGTFTLLTRIEVRAERAIDQLVWRGGQAGADAIVGRYGRVDGEPDVVKFIVWMYVQGQYTETPAQYLEIYYLRGVGEVVRRMGVKEVPGIQRSVTRMMSAMINGVPAEQIQEIFYSD